MRGGLSGSHADVDGQTQQQFGRVGRVTLRKSLNLLGLGVLVQNARDNDVHLPGLLWRVLGGHR